MTAAVTFAPRRTEATARALYPKHWRARRGEPTTAAVAAREAERVEQLAREVYAPAFPSTQLLSAAAALFTPSPAWSGHEGPRARVSVAAGVFGLARRDLARRERTSERQSAADRTAADQLAAELIEHGQFPDPPIPRQEITGWSRKSRSGMRRSIGEIDWSGMLRRSRVPAMITLTYPGDWLTVAPTGRAAKRHLRIFRRRFERAWGQRLGAFWKLEFQRRGAPHFHLFMVPPHGTAPRGRYAGLRFKRWLSLTWADVVNHPDPAERQRNVRAGTGVDYAEGLRARDPRRIAEYFAKHGAFRAKEYQHIVPPAWRGPGDGPGRFWGYWRVAREVYAVEVSEWLAVQTARLVRRWHRAKGDAATTQTRRTAGGAPRSQYAEVIGLSGAQLLQTPAKVRTRESRRRIRRMRGYGGAGWVAVNDGASFASQVARWLTLLGDRLDPAARAYAF